jgi:hypothetical protein
MNPGRKIQDAIPLPFAFAAVLKARIDAIRCRRDPPATAFTRWWRLKERRDKAAYLAVAGRTR